MFKRLILGAALTGMLLTACGSDGSSGDGGADVSGAQAEAADAAISAAEEGGFPLDEGCVKDLAAQLSDEDAEAIVASGPDDADLSAEGEALSAQLLTCADPDAMVDVFIEGLTSSGQDVDEECAREALKDFDVSEMMASSDGGDPPAELIQALLPCFDLGG